MILVDLLQKPYFGYLKFADIYFDAFALIVVSNRTVEKNCSRYFQKLVVMPYFCPPH
jgi:hypothetical protein